MQPLQWVILLVVALIAVQGSPTLNKDEKKKCKKVTINRVNNKRKCYGLPDRLVCEERYKQVCENVVTKDSRVECSKQVIADHDEEVCETELINQCHTTYTTVYEDQCETVNKVECHGGYSSSYGAPASGYGVPTSGYGAPGGSGGSSGSSAPAAKGGKKGKKGKKGRKKRGVVQAILLQNALNQRNPIRINTTPAPRPAPTGPVCYTVPQTTCKQVGRQKPETHCEEVEGETLCARTPKFREVQTCRNVQFDVPNVSCRHMPWKVCENAPNKECHSARVINRGVGHRKVCS